MRNITEHWETNRRRLQEQKFEGRDARSLRWYRDLDLINGPWSWGWGRGTGFELAQVLRLDLLVKEVSNVELIMSQTTVSCT
jgi:hypothetical protein